MKIKVASPSFSKNQFLRDEMLKCFEDVVFNDGQNFSSEEETIDFLIDAEIAIIGTGKITESILSKLPKLKMISKFGVGTDNIEFDALEKHQVLFGWSGGVNKRSVSEMALGFMLGLTRNLYTTSIRLKNGEWYKNGGYQLSEKKIGIIGFGFVGQDLAKLLMPFGCEIYYNDIEEISHESHAVSKSKEYIFENCDVVSLHVPLTNETKNLIDLSVLQSMKDSSFLINTCRGGVVNQEDLKKALKEKLIAGAATDVYEIEPVKDLDLLGLENLYCTPHIGGNAKEAVIAMGMSAINHIKNNYANLQK